MPSLITVISSEIRKISSILCEMYIIPQPCFFSEFIISKRRSASGSVSEEVGSSNTITRAPKETAFAISIICRFETLRRLIFSFGFASMPRESKISRVFLRASPSLTNGENENFEGYLPIHIFSATLRLSA